MAAIMQIMQLHQKVHFFLLSHNVETGLVSIMENNIQQFWCQEITMARIKQIVIKSDHAITNHNCVAMQLHKKEWYHYRKIDRLSGTGKLMVD